MRKLEQADHNTTATYSPYYSGDNTVEHLLLRPDPVTSRPQYPYQWEPSQFQTFPETDFEVTGILVSAVVVEVAVQSAW